MYFALAVLLITAARLRKEPFYRIVHVSDERLFAVAAASESLMVLFHVEERKRRCGPGLVKRITL